MLTVSYSNLDSGRQDEVGRANIDYYLSGLKEVVVTPQNMPWSINRRAWIWEEGDAALAIISALNLAAGEPGRKIILTDGVHPLMFTSGLSLLVKDNTTIQGEGRGTQLFLADDCWRNLAGAYRTSIIQNQYGLAGGSTNYGIVIRDLSIDANWSTQTGLGSWGNYELCCINLLWANSCLCENLWLKNAWHFGLRAFPSGAAHIPAETNIQNVWAESCGWAALRASLPSTVLSAPSLPDDDHIHVVSVAGFAVNQIIRIGNTSGWNGDFEYRQISAVDPVGLTLTLLGAATVLQTLWYPHAAGQTVKRIDPTHGGIFASDGTGEAARVTIKSPHIKDCFMGVQVEDNAGGVSISDPDCSENWTFGIGFFTANDCTVHGGILYRNWLTGAGGGWGGGERRINMSGVISQQNKIGAIPSHGWTWNGGVISLSAEMGALMYAGEAIMNGVEIIHNGQGTRITHQELMVAAGGYVNCIESDIGKQVRDDGVEVGLLMAYNNTTRKWWIKSAATIADLSVMTITAGTGAGTASGASSTVAGAAKPHGIHLKHNLEHHVIGNCRIGNDSQLGNKTQLIGIFEEDVLDSVEVIGCDLSGNLALAKRSLPGSGSSYDHCPT